MYEPGSTFKLQTAAMTLDSGVGHLWSTYDAAHDIQIGRFTISDFQGKHRVLTLPEVIAYSSNLGAAHMAQAMGAERQRSWLQAMGMFARIGIELPEQGQPIVQPAGQLEGGRDHDRGLRPRHRGLAAARRARHGGDRQWRHRAAADDPGAGAGHGAADRHAGDAAIAPRTPCAS